MALLASLCMKSIGASSALNWGALSCLCIRPVSRSYQFTKFLPQLLCSISSGCSESGAGRVVSEHVVTYTQAWSVTPTCPL
jgi:hypothetical protein